MYKNNQVKESNKTLFLLVPLLLFTALGVAALLEYRGVTNFYGETSTATVQSPTGEIPSAAPTNTVDYTPASPDDNVPIPDKDPSAQIPTPVNNALAVTITSTRNNTNGDKLLIKAAVSGTDSGTCQATLTLGNASVSSSGTIGLSSGQYSCNDLEVPLSQLSSGEWNISLTVTDANGAEATTTSTAII